MGKRIAVVGGGAVGGYIAAHLAADKQDVSVVDAWPEHVEAMRSQGLKIIGMVPSESMQTRIPAMHITEVQGLAKSSPIDIAIVSVKSYDTLWATALIAPYLASDGYVVSAQNGINEERIASIVGWERTVGCVVGNNFAVDLIEAGVVKRTMPKDPAVKSLELGEVHGRVTPRAARARGYHGMRGQLLDYEQPLGRALVETVREWDAQCAFCRHGHERQRARFPCRGAAHRHPARIGSGARWPSSRLPAGVDGTDSSRAVRDGAGRSCCDGGDRGSADPWHESFGAQQRSTPLDGAGHPEGTANRGRLSQRVDRRKGP